jgi:hypothetical protein
MARFRVHGDPVGIAATGNDCPTVQAVRIHRMDTIAAQLEKE